MSESWSEAQLAQYNDHKELERDYVILNASELIASVLKERGITRSELAKLIGKTKGYITQILSGTTNMTIGTLSDILFSMGSGLELNRKPVETRRSDDIGCVDDVVEWKHCRDAWSPNVRIADENISSHYMTPHTVELGA
jgi:transcriptional regulator with XRE-family HTH domain